MTNAEYIAGYVLAHRIYRAIRLDDHAANAVRHNPRVSGYAETQFFFELLRKP